jgi:hypothetical protein
MQKTLLSILYASAVAVFGAGCGTKCDELGDKFDECGFEAPEGYDEGGGEKAECTEENEKMAECLLGKSCDSLKSGEAFLECGQGG